MSLWFVRIFFLILCTAGGFAVSQVDPELLNAANWWTLIGFGFGGLLIAIEEMMKGFSLRTFSSVTFGLMLGTLSAWMVDQSGLFQYGDGPTRWLIRLCLFIGFGYLGMVLAVRSNKEDFALVIPFVRFRSQHEPEDLLVLDTSVIIDGRIAELLECGFLEGIVIVPRFVLRDLNSIGDSSDPIKRARGRHGLETLSRIRQDSRNIVKIHEAEVPSEKEVEAKLIHVARTIGAKLITCDYNLSKVAELHSVPFLRINDLALALKKAVLPGEIVSLKLVREGKEKGQGIGYLNEGTMVVVVEGRKHIGKHVDVQVTSLVQTGAGVIIFGEVKSTIIEPESDSAAGLELEV